MRSQWSRMGPESNVTGVLRRWPSEDTDTQGERHVMMEGGWSDAASQGMPKTAGNPPEARKGQRRIPLQWDRGSADTFILDC